MDFLRASSWCACLECDKARCGNAGVSELVLLEILAIERATPAEVADRLGDLESKKDCGWWDRVGDPSTDDVSGVVMGLSRKLVSMCENSDEVSDDRNEDFEVDAETDRISGAFNACMLVVEINSVGSEILSRLIVPGAYLTLPSRTGSGATSGRRVRLVNALARDMLSSRGLGDG